MELLLIPVLAFSAVVLLVYGVRGLAYPNRPSLKVRLERYALQPETHEPAEVAPITRARVRLSAIPGMDRLLSKGGYGDRVAADLARAGVPLRVGEYLFIRWCVALVLFYLGLTFSGLLPLALLLGLVGYLLPRFYLHHKRSHRSRLLEQQLVDALTLMAGTLRAGHSFLQALESVRRELSDPISEEFRLLLEDMGLGARPEDALLRLAERSQNEELDMAVTAMLIQRSTGGNLAEVLENVAATVRDRLRIRREVRTLTAQERYSSYIVGVAPVAMFGMMAAMNPDYLFSLFGTGLGQIMLAGALFLSLIGFVVIQRIMDIDI